MFDISAVLVITLTFLFAGTVKGVIGLGLPTVSLGLLTVAFDLTSAMALLLVPSFVTNVWQALAGEKTRETFLRIWPFLLAACATVGVGAAALTRLDHQWLSVLLGVLLIIYALVSFSGFRLSIGPRYSHWVGVGIGVVNGVLTGMTGSFVVPGVIYLQAIGLSRDALIQAMGMLFSTSTLTLAIAMQNSSLLTMEYGLVSCAGLIPVAIGMMAGQRIRRNLSEQRFRMVFFSALLMLGSYIVVTNL